MKQIVFLAIFGYLTWYGYNNFLETDSFKYGIYTNSRIGFSVAVPLDWSEVEKSKHQFYQLGKTQEKALFLAIPPNKDEAVFMVKAVNFRSSESYALDGVTKDVLQKKIKQEGVSIRVDKDINIDGVKAYRLAGFGGESFFEYIYFVVEKNIVEIAFRINRKQIKKYNEAKIRIINSLSLKK